MQDLWRREAIGLNHIAATILLTAAHMPVQSRIARALELYAHDLRPFARQRAHDAGHKLPIAPDPQRRDNVVAALPDSEVRRQEAVALNHVARAMWSVADVLPSSSLVGRDLYRDADQLGARAAELVEGDPRTLPPNPSPPLTMPLPRALVA